MNDTLKIILMILAIFLGTIIIFILYSLIGSNWVPSTFILNLISTLIGMALGFIIIGFIIWRITETEVGNE